MKKLYLTLSSLAIFILVLFASSDLKYFFSNQIASVIGVEKEFCPSGRGGIFEDEIMIHVNKDVSLVAGYTPRDLVSIPKEIKTTKFICIKKDVVDLLRNMFEDAKKENLTLAVSSGFRSSKRQSVLYKALILLKGEKAKDRIAEPLHSEHQLGTTVDITGKSINYLSADDKFDGTVEDFWLKQNAYKYGFVLSYPKDKELVTGYDYEPWHYRYVGIDIAKEIFKKGLSVEEYFNLL